MPADVISETDTLIGKIIRDRRETLKMTQVQLAAGIGVTFQQVQKYERGVNRVSAAALLRIADVLKCHVADLYGDADPLGTSVSERAILKLWAQIDDAERDAVIGLIRAFLKR